MGTLREESAVKKGGRSCVRRHLRGLVSMWKTKYEGRKLEKMKVWVKSVVEEVGGS